MTVFRQLPLVLSISSLMAASSCSSPPGQPLGGPEPLVYDRAPEPPAILRDVAMVNDDNEWNGPFIPGLRTTMDGRVALRVQGGPSTLSFSLFVPEGVEEPILTGPAGLQLVANATPFQVVLPPAAEPNLLRVGHHTICDPTQEFALEGERPNPYACGTDLANDCYDITVISSISESFRAVQMWGTPVTVEVASPKTVDANIVRVELGTSVQGAEIPLSPELAEVAVTIDGRLLTGRLGGAARYWTNPNTGEEIVRSYDLIYSVLPDDAAPCDITAWTDFHPISHAPFDPNMRAYGLAAYPFRDSEGRLVGDGEDMGGSYPWVDREGANVFMTGVPGFITEQSQEDYPRRCVVDGCEQYDYAMDFDRGFLVAGLWTHGKLVHLDSRINNVDWSVGMRPDTHYLVDLYRDPSGDPVAVRFGSGRGYGSGAPGHPANENILDSLQHLLNHVPALRPVTPRDVVWIMNTGVATDEVVFDDFLDPRAYIVSSMQASVTQLLDHQGRSTGVPVHWNGQHRDIGINLGVSNQRQYRLDHSVDEDVHIQNAATSLGFAVPSFGLVEAGTGRTEPVALGGFYGRGFWLDGDNRIVYTTPAQEAPIEGDWYVGLFIDPRTTEGATRALITFPDGTAVRLVDRQTVQYVVNERVLHEVALPPSESGWVHLGWHVRREHRELTLLVNGFPLDRYEATRRFFDVVAGELIVGRGPDRRRETRDVGVRGWVDDLKVLAHAVDPEVACNHAGGTLVALSGDALGSQAALYPEWAHAEVAAVAGGAAGTRYACFHDYRADNAATLANIPAGTTSVRQTILFPEGPLRAGVPRPDSSANQFCLSCHSDAGIGPMGLGALAFRANVTMENDRRRQPHQPPRRVFGNIPAGFIPPGEGPGSPAAAMIAPPEGVLIEPWLLPN
jgi:hypothetical protein